MIQKYLSLRFYILLILFYLFNQAITYSNSGIFTRIGIDQGIAPGNVNDIIQDSLGFIWLATESGLCRYDGYKFIIYQNDPSDSSSLSFNNVFSLLKGENGIIWVGTLGGGLNKFDTKTEKFISYTNNPNDDNSISHNIVFQVYSDSKNQLWVSTLGGGLNLFNPKTEKFKRFLNSNSDTTSISSNMASVIFEDTLKQLWIGTFDGGLNRYNYENNTFSHYKSDENNKFSINHNQVMDILHYSGNELLIATFGGGINILDTKTMLFKNYSNSKDFKFKTEHLNIRKLFDDGKNIWIGSYNGLYKFDKSDKAITKFSYDHENPNSINNNKIREIYEDDSEVIWVGTTQGLNLFDQNRKNFNFHPYDDFVRDNIIPKKTINFSSTKKIMWPQIHSDDTDQNISSISFMGDLKSENKNNTSTYINFYMNCDNILWFGDYNGLKYYDKNSREFRYIEYFDNKNKFQGRDFVKSFLIDSDNNFWAGTLGGGLTSYNFNTKEFKKYIHLENDSSSISDSRIIPILEDSYRNLWIGTYGGLNKFDFSTESFIRYTNISSDEKSISNNRIYSIYESNDKNLWIGTYQGLNKYIREDDSFEHITVEEGLADNTVYTIQEDKNGNLWIRTNKGISKYNPNLNIIKNYTSSDGLVGMEYESNISFTGDDGQLYFSGLNGFNSFDPNNIHDNLIPPKIVFTELRILDSLIHVGDEEYLPKSLNEIDELVLSYKDKVFTIEFAAMHFAISAKNQYAFMLEGFRDEWTYVDSDNRKASFTNLNPGKYVLHVIASNNDGIWNKVGRTLNIIITPPYWETWWFQVIIVASILLAIFSFYEYRLHRLLEIERTRSRIARNLHDDVGGTLASIQYFINAIRKNPSEDNRNKFLDLIMASSNDAQDKIRDIIWTVNPQEDKLSRFLVKFNRYASDLFDSNGISYSITFPKIESDKSISMEKRQHLWCICKETVINTVKHSNCKNVNISFKFNGNSMAYNIKDDGIGFDKNKQAFGNGLNNIVFRADKLKADYDIATSVDGGMNFYLSLDI